MAIKPGSGNGLGAQYCTAVFAFSEGNDYCFTRVLTMGSGPASLVIDPQDKKYRLIHTSFRQGTGIDRKEHSFFIHKFYKWELGAFRPDTSLPPVWIQFLKRPNHVATKLLTPVLKEKAWNEDDAYKMHFRIDW